MLSNLYWVTFLILQVGVPQPRILKTSSATAPPEPASAQTAAKGIGSTTEPGVDPQVSSRPSATDGLSSLQSQQQQLVDEEPQGARSSLESDKGSGIVEALEQYFKAFPR